jgi:hypothetical protein
MDDNVATGYSNDQEHHWTRFQTAFKQTYTDLGEKVSAETALHNLKME